MSVGKNDAAAQHSPRAVLTGQAERYLAEVGSALAARGVVDRAEIVAGLREHLEEAAQDAAPGDTTALDVALRELGDPQLIAAEAAADSTVQTTAPAGRWTSTWVPVVALGLVLVGTPLLVFVVPALLVVAGLVLLWGSSLWTLGEKAVASLAALAPGTVLWIALSVVTGVELCTTETTGQDVQTVCTSDGGGAGGIALSVALAAVAIAGLVITGALGRRALRRAAR